VFPIQTFCDAAFAKVVPTRSHVARLDVLIAHGAVELLHQGVLVKKKEKKTKKGQKRYAQTPIYQGDFQTQIIG
jgi:hypothetical protein